MFGIFRIFAITPKVKTYLQAVSLLPLSHQTQLPLGVTDVPPESCLKEAALAASQIESAAQAKEFIQRNSEHLEKKLLVAR